MGHDSDCAVHSEPAYPAGECNCSACDELRKLRADLAAARRELSAWRRATGEANDAIKPAHSAPVWIERRVAELLAQDGVVVAMTTPNVISNAPPTAQPQYREPTLEDAMELLEIPWAQRANQLLPVLKQRGFVRKVRP